MAKRQLDPALLRSSIRELSSSPQKPLAIHHIESSQHAGCTHEPLSPCSQAYRTRGPQYPRRPLRLLRRSSPRNGPVRLALHHPRARRERFCGRLVSFFFNLFSPSSCNRFHQIINVFSTVSELFFFVVAHQRLLAPGTMAASFCLTSIRTNPRSSFFARTTAASKWARKSASVFRSIIPKNGRRLGGFVQHSRPSARS